MHRILLAGAGTALIIAITVTLGAVWKDQRQLLDDAAVADSLPPGFTPDRHRGEELYHLGGCINCHRGEGEFHSVPSGGTPLHSVVGTFHPPNITPDRITGIGAWSSADFVNAMRQGRAPDGRHYYAAFPYPYYDLTSVVDLLHLKAHLDSLPPVTNTAPPHDLTFPFSIRLGNLYWKVLFHDPGEFVPVPGQSPEWNLGNAIVNGLGHCGMCHTPKGILFNDIPDRLFAGAPPLDRQDEAAPRLAGLDPVETLNGLDEWSGAISEQSPMHAVTLAFSHHLPRAYAEAVAIYLANPFPPDPGP